MSARHTAAAIGLGISPPRNTARAPFPASPKGPAMTDNTTVDLAKIIQNSDTMLHVFLGTAARNVDYAGPWDDFDLAGGLESMVLAIKSLATQP